jgi:hypothetical protein
MIGDSPLSLLIPFDAGILLIEAAGARILRDQRVSEDTTGTCDEEASRTPRGKRMPAAEINQQNNFTNTKKPSQKAFISNTFETACPFCCEQLPCIN